MVHRLVRCKGWNECNFCIVLLAVFFSPEDLRYVWISVLTASVAYLRFYLKTTIGKISSENHNSGRFTMDGRSYEDILIRFRRWMYVNVFLWILTLSRVSQELRMIGVVASTISMLALHLYLEKVFDDIPSESRRRESS